MRWESNVIQMKETLNCWMKSDSISAMIDNVWFRSSFFICQKYLTQLWSNLFYITRRAGLLNLFIWIISVFHLRFSFMSKFILNPFHCVNTSIYYLIKCKRMIPFLLLRKRNGCLLRKKGDKNFLGRTRLNYHWKLVFN